MTIIYKYRRVCRRHFEPRFLCRNNRISNAAVPTLHLAGVLSSRQLLFHQRRPLRELQISDSLISRAFWWVFSRRRHQRQAVLLTGLSDSGKTLLFVRLAYSQYRQTFTSMKENVEDYIVSNKTLKLIDLPGQERLRNKYFDQYKSSAKGIVYVIDSETVQKEIRDVAEYLYTILTDPTVQSNCPQVLILCNKQDQPLAKGCQVIKSLLEKELNLVRVTKSSQLQSVDPSQSNKTSYLGKLGKDFEFSQLAFRVDVEEGSANAGDDDAPAQLEAVQDWISRL